MLGMAFYVLRDIGAPGTNDMCKDDDFCWEMLLYCSCYKDQVIYQQQLKVHVSKQVDSEVVYNTEK